MSRLSSVLRAAARERHPIRAIVKTPGIFAVRVLKAFKANQGILLAGAVAYYTLLSLIPFLVLMLVVLSKVVDRTLLLSTLKEYLEFVAPGAGTAIVENLRTVLDSGGLVGVVVTVTMLLTSAIAFAVLENAMSVIFYHRVKMRPRRAVFSVLIPYSFMLSLAVGLMIMAIVAGKLAVLATTHAALSNWLLYLLGVTGEMLVLTAIYHVMPVGRMSWRHALIGGATATVLWEITRHILQWYFGSISHIQEVYGSFTTTIAVLVSVEIGAILLLLGAQVIAEYERGLLEPLDAPPKPMRT